MDSTKHLLNFSPETIISFKKEIIARAIYPCHQKEIMHNLKVGKIHGTENCPSPLPLQTIMVRLFADSDQIQEDLQCNFMKLISSNAYSSNIARLI